MKTVILDASAALAWLIPTQATERATALLAQSPETHFLAPDIFAWEVGNQIASRARRSLLSIREALALLDRVQIDIQPARTSDDVTVLIPLAVDAGLSLFDVAYLRLALETEAALASRDRDLIAAAGVLGLDVLDLRAAG